MKIAAKSKTRALLLLLEIVLVILALVELYPLFLIIITALKSQNDIAMSPYGLPKEIVWDNFVRAWEKARYGFALRNSVLISVVSIVLIVFLGAMAAYPLARKPSRLNNFVYVLFVSLIMIPFQMAMIPLYKLIKGFGWINTFQSVISVNIAMAMPFVVFLYTGFMKSIPKELEESARIDGCGRFRTFWRIVFPLLRPATATVVILNILNVWNDFLMPMLFLQKAEYRTVPVSLFSFQGQYNSDWSALFAALVLAMTPLLILYLFLQKDFIKGIAAGSVKG